jgi:hypothetical protein
VLDPLKLTDAPEITPFVTPSCTVPVSVPVLAVTYV